MKNFTLLLALFFSLIITAQNYAGKKPELLLGKKVTIKPLPEPRQKEGYDFFYANADLTGGAYEPTPNSRINTRHEALMGKTFEVLNVEPIVKFGNKYHKLTLKNSNGLVLYHLYEDKGAANNIFIVEGGLTYGDDFYCDYIKKRPFLDSGLTDYYVEAYSGLLLVKTSGKGVTPYYTLEALTVSGGEPDETKGATITLDNGAKIERRDIKPGISVNSYGDYRYLAAIKLTDNELELLKEHIIVHVKVGAFSKEIKDVGVNIKNALPCLLTK